MNEEWKQGCTRADERCTHAWTEAQREWLWTRLATFCGLVLSWVSTPSKMSKFVEQVLQTPSSKGGYCGRLAGPLPHVGSAAAVSRKFSLMFARLSTHSNQYLICGVCILLVAAAECCEGSQVAPEAKTVNAWRRFRNAAQDADLKMERGVLYWALHFWSKAVVLPAKQRRLASSRGAPHHGHPDLPVKQNCRAFSHGGFANVMAERWALQRSLLAVSYTHLTLPTNREV